MTPTAFCKLVENRLGYCPPGNLPDWKRHQAQANQVTRKIRTNPSLYTWENLSSAVLLLARERQCRTPIGVFAHVERAVKLRAEPEIDIDLNLRQAIEVEQYRGDPDGWVAILIRASGPYRAVVLEEYRASLKASA